MYSQNGEDEFLLKYFSGREPGRLIDIGAHDGRTFSNSLALIEAGWLGCLVEPNPQSMSELIKLHGNNKRVTLVNCAILPTPTALIELWSSKHAISTVEPVFKDNWQQVGFDDFVPVWVAPITPETLYRLSGPASFISIDVEDNNYGLANAMAPMLRLADAVCIEHSGMGLSCRDSLNKLFGELPGFRLDYETPENLIYCKQLTKPAV